MLLSHLVFPAKYRRAVFDKKVDSELKAVCLEIAKRYEIEFLEIGTDDDHVHFMIQSVPMYSPTKIVTVVKSITAREIFKRCPHVKKQLWGGKFWLAGNFMNTVGRHGCEDAIKNYIKNQGREKEDVELHKQQLKLFED